MVNAIAQQLNVDGFCLSTDRLREKRKRQHTHWTIVDCNTAQCN